MKAISGTDSSMPTMPTAGQSTRKLTPETVLDIWSRRKSQGDYARQYGVTESTVSAIQRGVTWSWLTKDAPPPGDRVPSGPRPRTREQLTERERTILNLRAQGLMWYQIADSLGLTTDATKAAAQRAKRVVERGAF